MQKHLNEHHQTDEKELILKPWSYTYVLDKNKGSIKTFTGPTTYTMTPNDVPVVFSENRFKECRLEEAIQSIPVAVEGYYLVVLNPSIDGKQPDMGSQISQSPDLDVGRRIIIPGPVTFTPWPGQMTQVIRGHNLRSNEYLLVKVYNEEEARQNWGAAVVKPATGEDGESAQAIATDVPEDLAVGKHYNIKGTKVSFYMPPTGVSVVPLHREMTSNAPEKFVRQALTLEVLEYAILVDEDGNKRYERGPCVVFPKPTERFIEKDGRMKFRAIELNEIQGLHIKVIAPYPHATNGTMYEEGDELFITGKDTAIYYPREEHSLVQYDGKSKHFATAIPAGEGRYLMDRISGEIKTKTGPLMLLPDPRNQVIVRRVLSDTQCALWYPGNREVLEYNQSLDGISKTVPTTRSGAISDGDYERSTKSRKKGMDKSQQHRDQRAVMDEISRSSTYSQPRTVTFDNKFAGVPRVDVWTGYAVMVVSATGQRRVEMGPTSILMEYDETLEAMSLSTGKPKTTDSLLNTVFLRISNNNISDTIIDVETSDHVRANISIIAKVDFEGDSSKWWDIENYVKHISDHVRSVVKGAIKKITIEEFYSNSTDIVRDIILGKKEDDKRPGMAFVNGARIKDVDIMGVKIQDAKIQQLLDEAQHQVVQTNIALAQKKRDLEVTLQMEEIDRDKAQAKVDTEVYNRKLINDIDKLKHQLTVEGHTRSRETIELQNMEKIMAVEAKLQEAKISIQNNMAVHDADMEKKRQEQALEIENIKAMTQAVVERSTCIQPELAHNLNLFRESVELASITKGFGEFAALQGKGVSETMKQVLDHIPQNLRAHIEVKNGSKQLTD